MTRPRSTFASSFSHIRKKRGRGKGDSLRTTVAILKAQQEATLDGILVVDHAGKILSYNRRFLEIWGIPASVATSRPPMIANAIGPQNTVGAIGISPSTVEIAVSIIGRSRELDASTTASG